MHVELTADAPRFLAGAREHLEADPVLTTVIATMAERTVAEIADGVTQPPQNWWATIRDGAHVVGLAMRTAPFAPRPAYLLAMPDAAAVLLARTLHERGEDLDEVNGALPAARVFLEEAARLAGGRVEVRQHTRLFELGELVAPRAVAGRLRAARADEVDLVGQWFTAFHADADAQPGHRPDVEALLRRIATGRVWLWENGAGTPVHLTAANPPACGAARIGPVYTPPDQRGRGWASNAVAEVSRLLVGEGARACLFTDQANPTSNAIYQALGYRAVVDMADLVRRR